MLIKTNTLPNTTTYQKHEYGTLNAAVGTMRIHGMKNCYIDIDLLGRSGIFIF